MTSLACAFVASLAASCGGVAAPAAPSPMETVAQDDAELLYRSDERLERDVRTLRALGVDRVRINAGWRALAPAPAARRRPVFDGADSRAYPQDGWRRLDRAVKASRTAGLRVMLDVGFYAPRWAVERDSRGDRDRWEPAPRAFGDFARALARRYDGSFDDPGGGGALPRVRLWTTWNEPNHAAFLLPQWVRAGGRWRPQSPHRYRRMHEAAYAALKDVRDDNRVLVGGLTSRGAARPGTASNMAPLRFLRELACVDGRLRPVRTGPCRGFRAIRADGFAHHPYSFGGVPEAPDRDPGDVPIADLDRLSRLLDGLRRRGRIAGALALYGTEYGYETDPPDPFRGVSPATQADYLSRATYLSWRRPDVRMHAQFLLRDIGPKPGTRPGSRARFSDYQTGLYTADGRAKPAARAFPMPLVARAATGPGGARGVYVFGQVRPGRGAQEVTLEASGGGGRRRRAASLPATAVFAHSSATFITDAGGFYERFLPGAGAGSYRARSPAGGGRTSLPARVAAFGGPAPAVADLTRPRGVAATP